MADLLPLILFAAWRWPSLRLWHPLRALCVVLLLLVPVEPQIRRFSRGLDLWVLVDQSASAAQVMASQLPEWQSLLEKSKSRDDRIFYLDYAEAQQVLMLNGLVACIT